MIEIKRDGLPSTVTINEALENFEDRDAFMWSVLIELVLPPFDADGSPSRGGAKRLHAAETQALNALSRARTAEEARNAVYAASVASTGRRTTYLYVRDPYVATRAIEEVDKSNDIIEWSYDSKLDRGWTKIAFAIELLRNARKKK